MKSHRIKILTHSYKYSRDEREKLNKQRNIFVFVHKNQNLREYLRNVYDRVDIYRSTVRRVLMKLTEK